MDEQHNLCIRVVARRLYHMEIEPFMLEASVGINVALCCFIGERNCRVFALGAAFGIAASP